MGRNCFFIFVFIFNLYYYVASSLASPIIGGIEDTDFINKYHATVHTKDPGEDYGYLCGGSIIQERYVISSAHCFIAVEHGHITRDFNLLKSPAKIIAGTNKINGPGIERNVDRIFIPKIYDIQKRMYGDLAVLKLSEDLGVHNSNHMLIVRIGQVPAFEESVPGLICAHGYYDGTTNQDGKFVASEHFSEINRCLAVNIMGTSDSFFSRYKAGASTIFAITANKTKHRVPCEGDSGAGLIFQRRIVGVLSQGPYGCENNGFPTQFTRISDFRDFVNRAMDEYADHSDMHVLGGPRSHPSSSRHSPHHI